MLEQARRSMSRHVTTRTTRRACRVVTCRDVTQQVEFGFILFCNFDVAEVS